MNNCSIEFIQFELRGGGETWKFISDNTTGNHRYFRYCPKDLKWNSLPHTYNYSDSYLNNISNLRDLWIQKHVKFETL